MPAAPTRAQAPPAPVTMHRPSPPEPRPPLPAGCDAQTVFRSLFFAYPDAMLLVDPRGRVVLANPSAAELLGYPVDELTGLDVDALVPAGVRERHADFRAAYADAPRARPMGHRAELAARRKDGTEVRVEIALSPLAGQPAPLVVAAIRGVGAYPRVRQALQRAHYAEQLAQLGRLAVDARDPQTVVERVPEIAAAALQVEIARVFLLDRDRTSLRVASGFGVLAGEDVGARVPYVPDRSPGLVLAEGHSLRVVDYRTEQRFVVAPAYLEAGLVSALAVPVSDRGRTIGVLAVRSRSMRDFGDDELRFLESTASLLATSLQRGQSDEALTHAARLESVGKLTGGIAHDFNNLLTVIQGNLQVLDELGPDADNAYRRQLVAAASRAARRGAELTTKLLAFSRRQVLQPSRVDVVAMLQSLADMLRRTLDQRIRIEVDPVADCPPVRVDPSQLESALLNIAINARDAMPSGGTLRFGAAPCPALPASVRGEVAGAGVPADGFVAIRVADTGTGMPAEVRERAFEPFFTTKEAGRGTGLGLSTVYGFVKQSDGAVEIDSTPGAGTTLTLYIPKAPEVAAAGPPVAGHRQALPAGLQVLLVEDDAEVRAVIGTHLDTLGCEVVAVPSAEQALEVLDAGAGVALLLSDIALGAGMRGTRLAALAQERRPRLAIVLMSGFSEELLDADRDSPAAWELLPKPCSRDELAGAMARACGARAADAGG